MTTVNLSIVMGNLAKDAEIRRLPNFDACSMVLITERMGKKLEGGGREILTDSHRVQVLGKKGFFDKREAAGMLSKGASIHVTGERIEERVGEGADTKFYNKLKVQPYDLKVVSWPRSKGEAPAPADQPAPDAGFPGDDFPEDDIPF